MNIKSYNEWGLTDVSFLFFFFSLLCGTVIKFLSFFILFVITVPHISEKKEKRKRNINLWVLITPGGNLLNWSWLSSYIICIIIYVIRINSLRDFIRLAWSLETGLTILDWLNRQREIEKGISASQYIVSSLKSKRIWINPRILLMDHQIIKDKGIKT